MIWNKTLIVGMGEVGRALYQVLFPIYGSATLSCLDLNQTVMDTGFDIMHVCIPYNDNFSSAVAAYQERFTPKYTVIHSTLPVGTSNRLNAVHSPIRGLHPDLAEGILTFPKFIGGEQASEVADYFRRAGLKVVLFDKSETTEAMKLFDTLYYGLCIEFAKEVKRYCLEHDLNYSDVYRIPNTTYNEGYSKLGHPEFVRPVLEPILKTLGGHCILPNAILLDTPFSRMLSSLNDDEQRN